jgi:hypothetical protein
MDKSDAHTRISLVARELVTAIENHLEFKAARDRVGDRHFLASRTKLVEAIVSLAREIVVIARAR